LKSDAEVAQWADQWLLVPLCGEKDIRRKKTTGNLSNFAKSEYI